MSNGKYAYRVRVWIVGSSPIKQRTHDTHREAVAWAKEQKELHGGRACRDKEIIPLGRTELGPISIEITRERM